MGIRKAGWIAVSAVVFLGSAFALDHNLPRPSANTRALSIGLALFRCRPIFRKRQNGLSLA